MAFQDSAGNNFTNHSAMRSSEARLKAKSPAATAVAHEEEHGEPDAANEQDGKAIAAQHGPAVEIQIQHDHEGGQHSVHAVHPDMHEHQTHHASAKEAHKFASDLAGGHEEHESEGGEEDEY